MTLPLHPLPGSLNIRLGVAYLSTFFQRLLSRPVHSRSLLPLAATVLLSVLSWQNAHAIAYPVTDPNNIADNGSTDFHFTVSGESAITNISLRLNVNHTYISDLQVFLIAPDGKILNL